MTSKLKCPFCGDNLRLREDCIWGLFACSHPTCEKSANMRGTKELWQALIQAKQDLEVAVDALNAIIATPLNSRVIHDTANKALEQIEHKEQICL